MTALANGHTHCQAPKTDAKAKACQRVCLFKATTDRQSGQKKNTERTTACMWQ